MESILNVAHELSLPKMQADYKSLKEESLPSPGLNENMYINVEQIQPDYLIGFEETEDLA